MTYSEIEKEFEIHYTSEWRWKKERSNNLSATDFYKSKLSLLFDELIGEEMTSEMVSPNEYEKVSGYNAKRAELIKTKEEFFK